MEKTMNVESLLKLGKSIKTGYLKIEFRGGIITSFKVSRLKESELLKQKFYR